MFYFLVFVCLSIASCEAGTPVPPPVFCGVTPNAVATDYYDFRNLQKNRHDSPRSTIYQCLGTPKVVKPEASLQCDSSLEECERMTCIFTKSGWMKGNYLDKAKFSAHFDQFVKENPDWQVAVEHMKTSCLNTDLPAQGIHINCPAYDTMVCAFASFIKHAQPSQWSTSPQCEYPRQFAGACPVCPSDCFATAIPNGSCNACRALPRTP